MNLADSHYTCNGRESTSMEAALKWGLFLFRGTEKEIIKLDGSMDDCLQNALREGFDKHCWKSVNCLEK